MCDSLSSPFPLVTQNQITSREILPSVYASLLLLCTKDKVLSPSGGVPQSETQ